MKTSTEVGSQASDQDHPEEADAEAPSEVYMACVFQAGKLGIAAYDTTTAEVLHPPRDLATLSTSKGFIIEIP